MDLEDDEGEIARLSLTDGLRRALDHERTREGEAVPNCPS